MREKRSIAQSLPFLCGIILLHRRSCLGHADGLEGFSWDYAPVLSQGRDAGVSFSELPGFTRSTYERDHALITPESRVWAGQPGWKKALTAHVISPTAATGAKFVMLLAKLDKGGSAGQPPKGVERFVFVLDGTMNVNVPSAKAVKVLHADNYAFIPADSQHVLSSDDGAGLLLFERRCVVSGGMPMFQSGSVADKPILPVEGEVFSLRKLLPQTVDYDFNVHVMDFQPGQYLNVKEVHYNQHGLLLVQGQGIYRLADRWYPVQSGDAIWMAPYVLQWYGALGSTPSRYILFKDTTLDPGLY